MTLPLVNEDRIWLLKQLPQGSVGAEVGVFVGNFSHYILHIVKPTTLHLIDVWHWGSTRKSKWRSKQLQLACELRFAKQIKNEIVQLHHNTSMDVCRQMDDASLDWVYIDAGHTYELCYDDLTHWGPKVKPGGIIFGDDYDLGGVKLAFNQWRSKTQNEWEFLYLTEKTTRISPTRNFFLRKRAKAPLDVFPSSAVTPKNFK